MPKPGEFALSAAFIAVRRVLPDIWEQAVHDDHRRAAAKNFRYCADLAVPRVTVQGDDDALVEIVRRPIGVIAAIKPWNVPLAVVAAYGGNCPTESA